MYQRAWPAVALLFAVTSVLPAQFVPGRYIVELSTEPVADHVAAVSKGVRPAAMMRSEAAQSHRARIISEQDEVRSRLTNATVIDSVNTVANALLVQANDASQLAALPGVKRVLPVRKVHMLLDRAVVLNKVTDAWNRIGTDRAGTGIKIAIIDSGIDNNHPALKNSGLNLPSGFPRTSSNAEISFTNEKVIVARSYVRLLSNRDSDVTARDHVGHGTALAMIAAGGRATGPLATIAGIAPQAWLGNYKVFGTPGQNDGSSDDAILKAIDDAVADGMDIINISFGTDIAPRLADDIEVDAVERATRAGVIVVAAAGNNGPDYFTISSPATASSAIAVGATTSDRTFAASVQTPGLDPFIAIPSDRSSGSSREVSAPLADVGGDGLACNPLPNGSLAGKIALILRGSCTFEVKLNNAQSAGAAGAVVYAAENAPDPFIMSVGAATLPAEMVSWQSGTTLKNALASNSSRTVTMRFTLGAVPVRGNLITGFSATGPNVDMAIKPDVLALGGGMYTATQTYDSNGDMYDPSGFIFVSGTSFSTPVVAGVAALLKASHPGLTVDQYRSLLINSAAPVLLANGKSAPDQKTGAGLLDAGAAVASNVAVSPVSLSFGPGLSDVNASRSLTISNVGTSDESYSISADTTGCPATPSVDSTTVQVAAGKSASFPVAFRASGLPPGACEGVLTITGATSGSQARVPWWYGSASGVPARITMLQASDTGRRNGRLNDAFLFRMTDAAGIPVLTPPDVRVVSGGGEFLGLRDHDVDSPGMFGIDVRLGAASGTNTFEIVAGDLVLPFSITGTATGR